MQLGHSENGFHQSGGEPGSRFVSRQSSYISIQSGIWGKEGSWSRINSPYLSRKVISSSSKFMLITQTSQAFSELSMVISCVIFKTASSQGFLGDPRKLVLSTRNSGISPVQRKFSEKILLDINLNLYGFCHFRLTLSTESSRSTGSGSAQGLGYRKK